MSRIGAGVGAGIGGAVGAIGGVLAACKIDGDCERASAANDDAFMGMLGMFVGGVVGAAIGAGSGAEVKVVGVGEIRSEWRLA